MSLHISSVLRPLANLSASISLDAVANLLQSTTDQQHQFYSPTNEHIENSYYIPTNIQDANKYLLHND